MKDELLEREKKVTSGKNSKEREKDIKGGEEKIFYSEKKKSWER